MSDDDLHTYLHHLADAEMSEEAKIEILKNLREVMRSFVDRAFGDDAVQLALADAKALRTCPEVVEPEGAQP